MGLSPVSRLLPSFSLAVLLVLRERSAGEVLFTGSTLPPNGPEENALIGDPAVE